MTTFTLTPGAETFIGGPANDVFSGVGGGIDTLRGNGGNDTFRIDANQAGLIHGGLGNDRIVMRGALNNSFDLDLRITAVETFATFNTNHYGTVAQFSSFSRINPVGGGTEFHIFLQGAGGTLNLSTKYTATPKLTVEAEFATSRVVLTGSARGDEFIGSDFSDRIFGGGGNDLARGGAGNDLMVGGLGRDYLYGDDGQDAFLFNVAPSSANRDRIGDFRPEDDTIRLENSVFTGLVAGALAASRFKDIGVGTQDANDRVLYNSDDGRLYFDGDGLGGSGPRLIAVLDNFSGSIPTMTAADIFIV
jgi:Ca2+-binding RTX toxin-like protein